MKKLLAGFLTLTLALAACSNGSDDNGGSKDDSSKDKQSSDDKSKDSKDSKSDDKRTMIVPIKIQIVIRTTNQTVMLIK